MDAMEEHVNRALIELYFAIAELESAPSSISHPADEQHRRAIASALQAARNALETSAELSGASFQVLEQQDPRRMGP